MKSALILILSACLFHLTETNQERITSINQIRFYEDLDRQLQFADILRLKDSIFNFDSNFEPSQYKEEAAYWIELEFCIDDTSNAYLLEFFDQTIDTINVYISKNNEEFRSWTFGDQFPFSDKPILHKNFEITLQEAGSYIMYARIANRNYADIRLSVKALNHFIEYAINEYYLYGIFYGMILIISLYNISIYSAIREVKYLYYTFYILSVGLFAMCVDGIAFQYLWPNSPNWNHIAHGVALFSIIFWSIMFSKRFLNLKRRSPKIDMVLNWVLGLRIAVFLYALFVDPDVFNYRYIEIIPLSLIFAGSISVIKRGYKPARFFIVAYGFLFLGFLIKAMLMISVIPLKTISASPLLQIITYYSLHISFVFEMLFLSLALSDRVRILKETRDKAQKRIISQHEAALRYKDQINSQLEAKVRERTAEIEHKNQMLQESNQLLEEQKKDISEINSMLDLDNWKLRNNIKYLQKERILNKLLVYEEFCEVFPSKEASLEFLSHLKWQEGYRCKRCDNEKFINGAGYLARRCTRCGYNETPTAGTLFHAIKLPLPKALYLLYLHLNHENKSLSELSEILNTRKNTISAFYQKIEQHLEENGDDELEIFKTLESEVI